VAADIAPSRLDVIRLGHNLKPGFGVEQSA